MANNLGNILGVLLTNAASGFFNRLLYEKTVAENAKLQAEQEHLSTAKEVLMGRINDTSLSPAERQEAVRQLAYTTKNPYLMDADLKFSEQKQNEKKSMADRMQPFMTTQMPQMGMQPQQPDITSKYSYFPENPAVDMGLSPAIPLRASTISPEERRRGIKDIAVENNLTPRETNEYLTRAGFEPEVFESGNAQTGGRGISQKTKSRLDLIKTINNLIINKKKNKARITDTDMRVFQEGIRLADIIASGGYPNEKEWLAYQNSIKDIQSYSSGMIPNLMGGSMDLGEIEEETTPEDNPQSKWEQNKRK